MVKTETGIADVAKLSFCCRTGLPGVLNPLNQSTPVPFDIGPQWSGGSLIWLSTIHLNLNPLPPSPRLTHLIKSNIESSFRLRAKAA